MFPHRLHNLTILHDRHWLQLTNVPRLAQWAQERFIMGCIPHRSSGLRRWLQQPLGHRSSNREKD
jgi:hypothetical protein